MSLAEIERREASTVDASVATFRCFLLGGSEALIVWGLLASALRCRTCMRLQRNSILGPDMGSQ